MHAVSALFDTTAPQTMSRNCIAHQITGLETFQEISFVNVFWIILPEILITQEYTCTF